MSNKILLILLFVIANCQDYPAFTALSSLMQANSIKYTESILNCFSTQERELVTPWVNTTITKGAKGNVAELLQIPTDFLTFLRSLSNATQGCLTHNNDIQVLLHKFGGSMKKLNESYAGYVTFNYLKSHYYYLNMSDRFNNKKYADLGTYVNEVGHIVFGN